MSLNLFEITAVHVCECYRSMNLVCMKVNGTLNVNAQCKGPVLCTYHSSVSLMHMNLGMEIEFHSYSR